MKTKNLVVLIVVAVILVGWAYLSSRPEKLSETAALIGKPAPQERLFACLPVALDELHNGTGHPVRDATHDHAEARGGLALARPPGHHATQDRGMGFCLINNIAIGAEYLIQSKNAKSILILDLDLHHGNGTQDIFWARPEVGFCSIHQAPFYPGTGSLAEIGAGDGKGKTLNLPIPSYSGDQAYQTLLSEVIFPFMMEMQPEMVLVSFGFDTHWRDPLGSMQVTAECVYLIMKDLQQWSEENCNGRLAVILEGGYDLEAGKACGQAIGTALTGVDWDDPLGPSPVPEKDNWKDTLEAVRRKLKY